MSPFKSNFSRIAVGMSGGVDSSVCAALLKEQGFDVVGIFMKNWSDLVSSSSSSSCRSEEDMKDVRDVCDQLHIPFYTLNFEREYRDRVFKIFLEEYQAGRTPNPDVLCNSEIKFNCFMQQALAMGASKIATGHYARVEMDNDGQPHLYKGKDLGKDQSYFLSRLTSDQLAQSLFPLAHYSKAEVRQLARVMKLSVAEKKDSQGICFIGEVPMKEFLSQFIPLAPGRILTTEGKVIGTHDGLAFYTIGQRKGIGIGGGMPYYVVAKDMDRNELIVTRQISEEKLFSQKLSANDCRWLQQPRESRFACFAKIRYRQEDQAATVWATESGIDVEFAQPQRAITPGQTIVFYSRTSEVLGSAVIDHSHPL